MDAQTETAEKTIQQLLKTSTISSATQRLSETKLKVQNRL